MRTDLPVGTVTFLFTDVEGSTKLLHELGAEAYAEALAEHRRVIREACAAHGGVEVDTQGDAFFFAFPAAASAASAAAAFTEALASGPIQVRVGLHTGTPLLTDEGYIGDDVHFGARVASSGHGGQVVLSQATADGVDLQLTDLGEHRLKDIPEAVPIYQLGDSTFPPLKTISNTNLPRPASSFVGRERETAEVVALLSDGSRLLTLSGPGGSGKTRLAIEAAAELVPGFKAGVFWVGLASLRDPNLVTETIAQTLGAKDGLSEHIGEREMLLVIDNLEQVVECAPELAELVETCPNLRLLCTSRELLRVRGEVEYAVPPLADSEAVALFCQRAQLAPDEMIAELCRRLDDLPLAVELAAARTSVLTPEQILERLSQRLDLLKGGRDAEARQQTLRATIEWSYDLLTDQEQRLFARLSVFVGGCTLEAAEEVAEADLDTLQSLVDKSLLRFTDGRYWMLETIREYAGERLEESGEAEEMRRRCAVYFLGLAESANLCVERSELEQRHELVAPEADNLRSAMEWAFAARETELAASIGVALEQFWVTESPSEGARWMMRLLEHRDVLPRHLLARVLRVRGGMAYIVGDWDEGTRWHEAALDEFRRLGDGAAIAHMLIRGAVEAQRSGDPARARALCNEGMALDGGTANRAQALDVMAGAAFDEGEHEEALELLEQSARLSGRIGNRWLQSHSLLARAEYALTLGRLEVARSAIRDGLGIARAIGDRQWTHWGVTLAAWLAVEGEELFEAGRLWGALVTEAERAPLGQWEGELETWISRIVRASREFEQGSEEGARLTLDEAVDHALRDLD